MGWHTMGQNRSPSRCKHSLRYYVSTSYCSNCSDMSISFYPILRLMSYCTNCSDVLISFRAVQKFTGELCWSTPWFQFTHSKPGRCKSSSCILLQPLWYRSIGRSHIEWLNMKWRLWRLDLIVFAKWSTFCFIWYYLLISLFSGDQVNEKCFLK